MTIVIPNTVSQVQIDHNTFEGQTAGPTVNGIIRIGDFTNRTPETAVRNVRVTGNQFDNVSPSAVSVVDDAFGVTISDNKITTVVSPDNYPGINIQAVNPGTAPEQIVVSGNTIMKGTRNNCVQIQAMNSSRKMIRNVSVTKNVCRIEPGASGSTGYSMVSILGLTETGNLFDSTAETSVAGNAAFELAGDQNAVVSGNVAIMGTKTAGTTAFVVSASIINDTRNVTLTNNSVSMRVAGTRPGGCFYVGANLPAVVEQISIMGNRCDLSGSTTTGMLRGVWVQSNNPRASVRGGFISGNVMIGTARANSRAIHFEKDSGALSGWHIGRNQLVNWAHPSSAGIP